MLLLTIQERNTDPDCERIKDRSDKTDKRQRWIGKFEPRNEDDRNPEEKNVREDDKMTKEQAEVEVQNFQKIFDVVRL